MLQVNKVSEKIKAGGLALGMSLRQSRSSDTGLIAEAMGFDWILIDGEHTAVHLDDACNIATAALGTDVTPFVRVNRKEDPLMTRYIDNGAMGIFVPHVDTPEDAQFVVDRCKFAPIGKRSISRQHPGSGFNLTGVSEYIEWANRETMVVAMLESPEGIDNCEAIAAIDGVDSLLIGAVDLTYEYGIPGETGHQLIVEAYEKMIAACVKYGKIAGMAGIREKELIPRFMKLGARFILCDQDLRLMMQAGKATSKYYRDLSNS